MYEIANDDLTVHLLDPEADLERFGPRYCTGGYIFQIDDERHGPLLTGPTYPETFSWFHGQGIPDAFNLGALRDAGSTGAESLVPGIGVCDMGRREVLEYCDWTVSVAPTSVVFETHQSMGRFSFDLERAVSLFDRTIRSSTVLRNSGAAQVPVCWFPHPFFPYVQAPDLQAPAPRPASPASGGSGASALARGPATGEGAAETGTAGPLCRLPGPVAFDLDRGYSLDEAGFFHCSDWKAGGALPVACNESGPLTVLYRHPALGLIAATFSYSAAHVLLWGNDHTFSFEPYLERTVGIGRSLEWTVEYHL